MENDVPLMGRGEGVGGGGGVFARACSVPPGKFGLWEHVCKTTCLSPRITKTHKTRPRMHYQIVG